MNREQKIVYVRETTVSSIVSDLFTFGTIVGSFWFNQHFIDGNNWLDALLFISFFIFAIGTVPNIRKVKDNTGLSGKGLEHE